MFDLDRYMIPFWEGDVVEDEACFVMEDEDGCVIPVSLLYKPDKVLKVTDYTLTVTYEEGKDYMVEDGKIIIIPEGRIPVMKSKDFFLEEKVEGKSFMRRNGKFLAFAEWVLMYPYQIAVTYEHSEKWERYIPESKGAVLTNFIKKLENREPVKILVFGDSISAGANATSLKADMLPGLPMWDALLVRELKKKYGYDDIEIVNTSVGGKASGWGVETVEDNAVRYNADLAIIGFGMNNSGTPLPDFKKDIEDICKALRKGKSDTDIVLLATMVPNKLLAGFWGNQMYQQYVLNEIAEDFDNMVVCNMTEYHKAMLETKKFEDMTGNNVNHPNDFLIRGYAQCLYKTLEK
ncbi:MAG: SGNH/GDSL hydrolase family protein [Clostridia bacterium]|nr:SGNH/GDSL hydrolase family protein [Clostridia bacterium]